MLKLFESLIGLTGEELENAVLAINESLWTTDQKALNAEIRAISDQIREQAVNPETFEETFPKAKGLTAANKEVKTMVASTEKALGRACTIEEKHNARNSVRLAKMAELTKAPRFLLEDLLKKEKQALTMGAQCKMTMEPKPEDAPKSKKPTNVVYIDRTGDPNKKLGWFQRLKIDSKGNVFLLMTDSGKQLVGEILADSPTQYSYAMAPIARIKELSVMKDNEWVDLSTPMAEATEATAE